MVKPMPASEAGKTKVGNVGDERWQRSRLFASDENAQAAKILVLWIACDWAFVPANKRRHW